MIWKQLPAQIEVSTAPAIYQCEPGWNWMNPRFVDFDLWLVLAGEGWVETAGNEFRVSRGDAVLFRPGDSVKAGHNPGRPLKVFAVHFALPPPLRKALCREVPRLLVFHDMAQCELAVKDLLKGARLDGDLCEMRLALLLALGARDAKRKVPDMVEEKLKVLCMEMGANPSLEWDPESMARRIGLSLPQFNRRFRALAGTSAARYLILRRVDRARLLLRETTMSLQEIAASLGYRDIYYFHRQFRTEAGRTPASFRKNPGGHAD